jgi:DNA/RNA-binding domain of Phe-tRNA-synthetase-like protein
MTKIEISVDLKSRVPEMVLGCIECDVQIEPSGEELLNRMRETENRIKEHLPLNRISQQRAIQASRRAYKACGKDPARYRLSAEALTRRVVRGLGLYRVNNVVDLVNLISLETGISIGGYDAEKIEGDVRMGMGESNEPYQAIGRGDLNIEFLPVFRDGVSAFGSPTSDSERTSVTDATTRFLMVIIGFSGQDETEAAMKLAVELLARYGKAENIGQRIVS